MYGWTLSTILSLLVRGTTYSIHRSELSGQPLSIEEFVIISCSKGPSVSVEWLETDGKNSSLAVENSTTASIVDSMVSTTDNCCISPASNVTVKNAESQLTRRWSNSSKEIVTCEGADVEFFCNVTGSLFPRVNWRKNKDLFPGESLMISNVQRHNRGTYWCEVSENGSAIILRKDVTLVVEFPPVCLITVPNIDVVEINNTYVEEECILQCVVEAFPIPIITWYKEDAELDEWFDPQFNVTLYEVDNCTTLSELRIVVVNNGTFMDGQLGNYTCRAVNKHGTSSAILHLIAACEVAQVQVSDGQEKPPSRNATGFIIGMVPPIVISVYLIIQLGYRSRFADERGEQDGARRQDYGTR